jgi:hypothetical protein
MTSQDHRALSWPYPVLPEGWRPYDDSIDYCGPEGRWYSAILSRYLFGIDCNMCYWAHDERYRTGVTDADRRFADVTMWRDQVACIRRATHAWSPRRYAALVWARRRYRAVRLFGESAFNEGKI